MSVIGFSHPQSQVWFPSCASDIPDRHSYFYGVGPKNYDAVEAGRDDPGSGRAFSYRKSLGLNHDLFAPGHTYRDWLRTLQDRIFQIDFSHVIRTDISDFYLRVSRHRLENILESLSGETRAARTIEKLIADWWPHQSFGLPVGSNAARLLAEAALNDTDMALIAEGLGAHSPYVDDIVVFVRNDQDPYATLAFLAKHLSDNEGLSLNIQKTKILEWDEFLMSIHEPAAEDEHSKVEFATEKLFWAAYGHDDLNEDALSELAMKDLSKELEELLAEQFWDMGRIRIVLYAMRLVKNDDIGEYIRSKLRDLVPFAKDVCLLIEEFTKSGIAGFDEMSGEITELLLSPRMRPLDSARAWFLELGVRKIVTFDASQVRSLDNLTGTLDIRQLHLIRWRLNDQNYFRARKARVSEIQAWAQPSFIFGCAMLASETNIPIG